MRAVRIGIFAAATAAFAFAALPTLAEGTANEALKLYEKDDSTRKTWEHSFAMVHLGLAWSNSSLKVDRKAQPFYCEPEKFVPTGNQLADMLRREIEREPYIGDLPFGLALMATLQSIFPCQRK